MTSVPRLIDQLVDLTAIRDLELLEFSLLKTLNGFLHPLTLTMLRLDAKGRPISEIRFNAGNCDIVSEGLTLAEDVQRADNFLVGSDAHEYVIRRGDQVLTVLNLLVTRTGRSRLLITTVRELSRLDAHMIAGIVQIYRNFCTLVMHAQTDQLTGLANRKTFDECVAKVHELLPVPHDEVAHERRSERPMQYWLVMVDIDHFKRINDRFGHLYGDEVLVLLSQLMKASFREDDMLFRFGGEEFVLIIRCPEQVICWATLERFRATVEQTSFPQVGQVTISIGVTQMQRDVFTGTILDRADKALYHSKENGRNCINFYEDMLAAGVVEEVNITPGGIDFF